MAYIDLKQAREFGDVFYAHDSAARMIVRAFLDNVPKVEGARWIPVTEGVPENGEDALVCVTDAFDNVCLVNAFLLAQYDDESWILEMWPERENPGVTHWMPLPGGPEVEG